MNAIFIIQYSVCYFLLRRDSTLFFFGVIFRTCDDTESSICSFPSTHIQLTKRQQFLMVGQRYKIYLTFEMPESEANKNLGMFMVCLELNNNENMVVGSSCRPVMLHYRSQLMYIIKTLVMAPLLILGTAEEKQIITVEMFSDYEEDEVIFPI